MPYDVKMMGGQWCTINTDTKEIKGRHGKGDEGKKKAMAQMRLLYGVENGMKVRK